MNELFLTPKDVAPILHLSVQQILRLTKAGKIPYINFSCGNKRIYPRYNLQDIQGLRGKNDNEEHSGEPLSSSSGRQLDLCGLDSGESPSSNNPNKKQKRSHRNFKEDLSDFPVTEKHRREVIEILSSFGDGNSKNRN